MFFFILAWINGWVNNGDAGDLKRHRTHYDVILMDLSNHWLFVQSIFLTNKSHQSSTLLARYDGNPHVTCGLPHSGQVMRKAFPFYDVIDLPRTQHSSLMTEFHIILNDVISNSVLIISVCNYSGSYFAASPWVTISEYLLKQQTRNGIETLRWRHNDHDSVSNHQPHGCLLNRLFRRRSKKTSKLRVTGLCVGNSRL